MIRSSLKSCTVRAAVIRCFIVSVLLLVSTSVLAGGAGRSGRIDGYIQKAKTEPAIGKQFITVILEAQYSSSINAIVLSHGGKRRFSSNKRHEIRLPANRLQFFAEKLPANTYLRFPYPHKGLAVTGQGVALTGAEDMQLLGDDGAGIKVGVIDMGFGKYATAQSTGDLPASLTITDYTGTGTGGISHGTNVAEIVHDMAPGADLYLAKVGTLLQLEQAMDDMLVAGVKVINHSVGWFGAAFYDGTGYVCAITDAAEAGGVQWINAMGNSRPDHYLGPFSDVDSDLRHEFAADQNYNTISLTAGTATTLVLNWDAYPTTNIDYNLYLYSGDPDTGGILVASSEDRQNGIGPGDYPYEVITYTPVVTGTYYIVARKYNSATPHIPFTLFSLGPSLGTKVYASSLTQPADCYSVLSVGAVNLIDGVEGFSSEGPTTDGRLKPEVSAPNRVVTSLSSSFIGTSGSAPHVAGAAALLLSQNPGLSTSQLRSSLINSAHDVSTSGVDYRTGYGRISLDADSDGLNHDDDNCPLIFNISQSDIDGDGLGDVCDDDIDGDGLYNTDEGAIGTDPLVADTDGDGLTDGDEVNIYSTDPLVADTDGDGLTDGDEVNIYSTDPISSDKGDLAPIGAPDGIINVADLMMLYRFTEGLDIPQIMDTILGDMNSDGVLNVRDVLLLRQNIGY